MTERALVSLTHVLLGLLAMALLVMAAGAQVERRLQGQSFPPQQPAPAAQQPAR